MTFRERLDNNAAMIRAKANDGLIRGTPKARISVKDGKHCLDLGPDAAERYGHKTPDYDNDGCK